MSAAIVRGGNKDDGNGIVELLAKHLDPSRWRETVEKFEEQELQVKFYQLDITDIDSHHKPQNSFKREYPNRLDILVNNAETAYKDDSMAPSKEQAQVTIATTNYTASVDMRLDSLPAMAKNLK
ncbi:unnamed protein product [Hymenolepis diminuta]|uniref:NAD(P)-binding protein n=1 Tax=Hymenolepis diminuta TaxID=6216 RepID=A0A0R3SKI6_HYMDI|nr:unnamed protein product [Hymenolepis diminuta]